MKSLWNWMLKKAVGKAAKGGYTKKRALDTVERNFRRILPYTRNFNFDTQTDKVFNKARSYFEVLGITKEDIKGRLIKAWNETRR